jgi:hypothetical protein
MPVKPFAATRRTATWAQLVDRLADEWRQPNAAAAEPVILEERNGQQELVHVYVVWSDWRQLDRAERGEIIMEAAERVKPLSEVLKITIAMGLTPDEADRFKVDWR